MRFKRYVAYYACAWAALIDNIMVVITFGLIMLLPSTVSTYQIVYHKVREAFYRAGW